jgi:NADPH-dependent curcumin reductase CurA
LIVGSSRVLKSRNPKFPEGSKVLAYVGWRDHTICNPEKMKGMFSMVIPMPDLMGLPDSYALGAVGMTGFGSDFNFHILDSC